MNQEMISNWNYWLFWYWHIYTLELKSSKDGTCRATTKLLEIDRAVRFCAYFIQWKGETLSYILTPQI